MSLQALKQQVVLANKELPKQQLVKYSWGNVSAIDTSGDVIVIKPVGMPYDELTEENISVVDRDGKVLGGPFNPSVDLDIHRALYLHFQGAKPSCIPIRRTRPYWPSCASLFPAMAPRMPIIFMARCMRG